jgi:uncharacterized phosphosugar-binding protein
MDLAQKYIQRTHQLLNEIEASELEKIRHAADELARSIKEGGILHLFGSGHSAIPTQEVYIRAGSLTNVLPLSLDRIMDTFERIEGTGSALMGRFTGHKGEVLIVLSNSGVNPLPIEVALIGKERGLFTIGISSYDHSLKVMPKHSSGKRLMDVVDLSIDSHVPYGDAGLSVDGLLMNIGPLSTLAGVSIVNAMIAQTIENLVIMGEKPPVRVSRNMPGGDENNRQYTERYANRIPELRY